MTRQDKIAIIVGIGLNLVVASIVFFASIKHLA